MLSHKNMQIIGLIVFAVAIKLYIDHRKTGYAGVYQANGAYDNITAVKHDMTKSFWTELFPLLIFGLAAGQKLYDPNDMLNSWVGKAAVVVASYFTYYEFVQPYVVNSLPNW